MEQKRMRKGPGIGALIAAGLLGATLALSGCSGSDGAPGAAGKDGTDGTDFEVAANAYVGVSACLTCHFNGVGEEYLASKHVIHSTHISLTSGAACLECHDPRMEGPSLERFVDTAHIPAGGLAAVSCEACHGESSNHVDMPFRFKPTAAKPQVADCGSCHTGLPASHLAYHPFADEIADRFTTSRHANQNARAGFCSACHSHEGAVALLARPRQTTTVGLDAIYTEDSIAAYSLPVGSETIVGVTKKNCATCHDSHNTALRGDGDVPATSANVAGFPEQANPAEIDREVRVAYSAEFSLCTACHMVDLKATWDDTAGYGTTTPRGMIRYELSDKYSAANLIDASTGTFDLVELENAGRNVFDLGFYHDGASGNGRTFVDTHFGGTIMSHLVKFDGLANDIVIDGYNINPGYESACTICHDPHTGGKMLSVAEGQGDNITNKAIGYAEELGTFHTNYLGDAFSRNQTTANCMPCHTGTDFVKLTVGATLPYTTASRWNVVGCRSCHDLAVANDAPGTNNAAAFAEVRSFPAAYEFAFNSGVAVAEADLGANRVCFECHKGRTAGLTQAEFEAQVDANTYEVTSGDAAGTYNGTTNYQIAYLHYAPSMAILFGDVSKMVPTYPGKTYAGRFTHYDGVKFGCVDCHNVHSTEGNHAAESKMTNPDFTCNGCHQSGASFSVASLQDRTEAYSDRLLDTVLDAMEAAYNAGTITTANGFQDTLVNKLNELFNTSLTVEQQRGVLMTYIEQRVSPFPNAAIAKAANVWKIFTYEDGAPHGPTHHGHGGAWAHNSRFARQVMYDAIEDLGGSLLGLGVANPANAGVRP